VQRTSGGASPEHAAAAHRKPSSDRAARRSGPAHAPPPQSSDTSLTGLWQGWGASYEVRFRQPNIMSVAVKHSTLFTFVVDHAGNIRGSGVIVYDLDPNLCGLANLVKYTNSGINIVAALPGIMTTT
jgi:hypothetical protein